MSPDPLDVAEQVRAALIEAARAAYEDAALRGLCADGAWEVAVGVMRGLDLSSIVRRRSSELGK